MINDKIKLIAHRLGFLETKYPENSLESLNFIFNNKEALDSCDGFEFDIVFTKDSVPVVIHDEFIDDVSNGLGKVKKHTLTELKKFDFGFRKSSNHSGNSIFKIVTLEEILSFFQENKNSLKNKIIKIETKNIFLYPNKNVKKLATILNDFPDLYNNIYHLSFIPNNLDVLRKWQIKNNMYETRTDLLCDYKFILFMSKLYKYIDCISFRVKTGYDIDWKKIENLRIYLKSLWNYVTMLLSNILNDKAINYALKNFSELGLYVINNSNDFEMLMHKINLDIINNNIQKISLTTDNPHKLKKLIMKKDIK